LGIRAGAPLEKCEVHHILVAVFVLLWLDPASKQKFSFLQALVELNDLTRMM